MFIKCAACECCMWVLHVGARLVALTDLFFAIVQNVMLASPYTRCKVVSPYSINEKHNSKSASTYDRRITPLMLCAS